MSGDVQLISDGDGILVVGREADVENFLRSENLGAHPLDAPRLRELLAAGSAVAGTVAEYGPQAAHWIKVSKETSAVIKKFGLKDSLVQGLRQTVLGNSGDAGKWVELVKSSAELANNPALASGAAGVMAQAAMEQLVAEIVDYLEVIDKKLDSVLRSQVNQVLARLDAIDLAVSEAAAVRRSVGRVSDVTWSKVQGSSVAILETQAFALRQLADLADQIDEAARVDDLAEVAIAAAADVQKWLKVLAICVRLYDSVAVVELDRVMDTAPLEVEAHLAGLRSSRTRRLELFVQATDLLVERMSRAVERANSGVLLNPFKSPAVVAASNQIGSSVDEFLEVLAVASDRQVAEARRWTEAASETWGTVRDSSKEGLVVVRGLAGETRRKASRLKGKLDGRIAEQGSCSSVDADEGEKEEEDR